MIEKKNPYLSEMARRPPKRALIQPSEMINLPKLDWSLINASIQMAEGKSKVWNTKPQMDHYTGIIKLIATVVGKVILYFGQVFTKHQESYNIAVLQSLHAITGGFRVIEGNLSTLESRINLIHTGVVMEMQNRIELLHDELNAGIRKIGDEFAEQRKLQIAQHLSLDQKISAIDTQLEKDKAENKALHASIDMQREKDKAENKTLHTSIDAKIKDLDAIATTTSKQIRMIENIEEKFVAFVSENLNSLATIDARIAGAYQRIEQLQKYGSVIDELSSRTATLMKLEAQIEERIKEIDTQMEQMAVIEQRVATNTARLDKKAQLWPRVDAIQQSLDTLLTMVRGQESRLATLLAEARQRLPKPFDEKQLAVFSEELAKMDNELYLAFENKFRGTHEEIINRVRVYLPVIQKAKAGTQKYPILDVGCGRGEWLELLRQENLVAYGLDINTMMVEQCKAKGLHVEKGDVLEYLKKQKDDSHGAVTGFHLIEHLPFNVWLSMFDESLRILKSGGVIIFETPNPANVLVGSNNFYLDPTHRNPLPGDMVKFMAEARGFTHVEILNLHPVESQFYIQEDTEISKRFNNYFYGPQDYAVIGFKP